MSDFRIHQLRLADNQGKELKTDQFLRAINHELSGKQTGEVATMCMNIAAILAVHDELPSEAFIMWVCELLAGVRRAKANNDASPPLVLVPNVLPEELKR